MTIKKLFVVLFFLLSCPVLLTAQDSVYYYDVNNRILASSEDAKISKEVKQVSSSCHRITVREKAGDSWVLLRRERIRTVEDGMQKVWRRENTFFPRSFERSIEEIHKGLYYFEERKSGEVTREGFSKTLIPLHLDGKVTEYYANGKIKSESIYSDNGLISNMNYNPDGSEYIHNIFYSVNQLPSYTLGTKFFKDFVMARIKEFELPVHEISDQVVIGAVIMETGELTGIKVLKGKVPSVNALLAETMKNLPGKWEPARLNGEVVRYFIEIPFNFSNDVSQLQFLEFSKDGQQLFWGL